MNRFEKGIVVQRVVDMVHARGGRFLKEDARAGTWYQLSEQQSKEKVGHAIRDAANLYEVRKKKEEQMQQLGQHLDTTPQLKRTGSDDDNKGSDWWKPYGTDDTVETGSHRGDRSRSYRSSYTPTDFSVDYSITSAAKRRSSSSMAPSQTTTDYQPQRKRRRTNSPSQPSYFQSTMELSDHILSTPSPHYTSTTTTTAEDPYLPQQHPPPPTSTQARRSPIIHEIPTSTSNVVSSDGSQKSSLIGVGGIMTGISSKLKSSPIAPIVPPPAASSKHSSSQQYYHRFTVYDPQEQQSSRTKDIHRRFQPEVERNHDDDDDAGGVDDDDDDDIHNTSPVEAKRPSLQSSQYSRTSSYPYGRSDFVRQLPIPPSSRFSPEEMHYHHPPPPPSQQSYGGGGPHRSMPSSGGILPPPIGHYPQPYPTQQQHYRHPQQRPPPPSYFPHTYYQPPPPYHQPPPQSRRTSTTPFNVTSDWDNTDTVEESTVSSVPQRQQQRQQQPVVDEGESYHEDGNGTNRDSAIA